MRWRKVGLLVQTAIVTALLGGCSGIVRLPDGQYSVMDGESNSLREALAVNPFSAPIHLHYRPIENCIYDETITSSSHGISSWRETIVIRPVNDKLFAVAQHFAGKDGLFTVLFDRNGHVYDFNDNTRVLNNQRWTPENFQQQAEEAIMRMRNNPQPGRVNPHIVRTVDSIFPDYEDRTTGVGGVIATVKAEDLTVWAVYVYRGTTNFNGHAAAVYDLRRRPGTSSNTYLVGFYVADLATSMPLLSVISSGFPFRLTQESCGR